MLGRVKVHQILLRLQFLVENEDAQSIANAYQISVHFSKFVNGLDLLVEEFIFQVVGQMGVIMTAGNSVQIQQRLENE